MKDNAGIEFETLSPREALEFGIGILALTFLLLALSTLAPGGPAEASEMSSAVDMTPTHARSQLALQSPFVAQAGLAEVGSGGGPVFYRKTADGGVYYQRRRWGGAPPPQKWNREDPQGWFTIRGGLFDANQVAKNDYLIGFKATGKISRTFWMGLSTDVQRREAYDQVRIEEFRDPTGNLVQSAVTTFASSSNLIPILAVMDIELPTQVFRPYAGIGGGYQILVVEFEDFENGLFSKNTYGGWGWQAWAGIALPFGKLAALTGEIYRNQATVSRDVQEVGSGDILTERINVDGTGIRAGLKLGF